MLIVALAEGPLPISFGRVPFIVRHDDGRLLVCGHQQTQIDEDHLRGLYKMGSSSSGATDVSALGVHVEAAEHHLQATWIGDRFALKCLELRVPEPDAPDVVHRVRDLGTFWIEPALDAKARIDRWIACAARIAVQRPEKALARLMRWADPFAPETEAITWLTCRTERERELELSWFRQVVPDLTAKRRTKEEIETQIAATIARLKAETPPA